MPSTISAGTTAGTAIAIAGDTTGNLAFQTNGTTTAMTIDTSQNVGIGTTTPASFAATTNLALGAGSSSAALTVFTGTAQTGAVYFADGTSGADRYRGAIEYTHSNNALLFTTDASERMRIDSAGRVLTPFRPAFVAHATGNSSYTSVANGTAFPANTAYYNQGSCYNTSNYRFTAPVTGLYFFSFSSIHANSSSDSRPTFFVNGSSQHNGVQHGINNRDASGSASNVATSLIYLQANDYVFISSSSGSLYYYGAGHSTFSGCLIG